MRTNNTVRVRPSASDPDAHATHFYREPHSAIWPRMQPLRHSTRRVRRPPVCVMLSVFRRGGAKRRHHHAETVQKLSGGADGGGGGGGRHGRARERVGRRQQLQGHFITGFGDRTERKLVYGRARRVRECGARRPDQWAVGRWRPVPRQRARAVATEERLPADRRRRRRRPR